MQKSSRIVYLEYMRVIAMFAVVMIHVTTGTSTGEAVLPAQRDAYAVLNGCYLALRWAVPCFFMITGTLLLNVEKELPPARIRAYIVRMLLVLLVFGVPYALMEIVFSEKQITLSAIGRAFLNTAEGNTWVHMWYVYELIAVYLMIPLVRAFISQSTQETRLVGLCILIAGNFVIPSINRVFDVNLYSLVMLTQYLTYCAIGFALRDYQPKGIWVILPGLAAYMLALFLDTASIRQSGLVNIDMHTNGDIFTLIQAVSVFLFVKYLCGRFSLRDGKIVTALSSCGFAVYLVHPFWLNLLYKGLNITPTSLPLPLGAAIIAIGLAVCAVSIATGYVLKKIPWIRKIV